MSNELSTATSHTGALAQADGNHTPAAVVQIGEWAAELDAAHKLGNALAMSNFLPISITMEHKQKKHPDQVAADAAIIILAGKSLGLDPLTSVQNIFSVRGRPAMYARTAVGLVMSHGHEVRRTDASSTSVTVAARRKGDKEWESFTWDMSRANQAGYTSNSLYKSDPVAMLTAKAQMEACRTLFADILLGVPYSAEDLQLEDLGEQDEKPKQTVKRKPKTTTKKAANSEAKEKPTEAAPSPEPADASNEGEPMISQQTWDEIKSLLAEKLPDENPGAWGMKTTGRTVKRWQEFTETDGDQMIRLLINGEVPAAEGEAA